MLIAGIWRDTGVMRHFEFYFDHGPIGQRTRQAEPGRRNTLPAGWQLCKFQESDLLIVMALPPLSSWSLIINPSYEVWLDSDYRSKLYYESRLLIKLYKRTTVESNSTLNLIIIQTRATFGQSGWLGAAESGPYPSPGWARERASCRRSVLLDR